MGVALAKAKCLTCYGTKEFSRKAQRAMFVASFGGHELASKNKFVITSSGGNLYEAGSLGALQKVLQHERTFWQKLIATNSSRNRLFNKEIGNDNRPEYDAIIAHTTTYDFDAGPLSIAGNRALAVLPPMESVTAVVLKDLLDSNDRYGASAVTEHWWVENGWNQKPSAYDANRHAIAAGTRHGAVLIAAYRQALNALKQRVTVQKIDTQTDSVASLVVDLQARSAQLEHDLSQLSTRMEIADNQTEARVSALRRASSQLFEAEKATHAERKQEWETRWAETHDQFIHQLQYRAPVALWDKKGVAHRKAAGRSMWSFVGILLSTLVFAGVTVFCLGDRIADSFTMLRCAPDTGECETAFSFKGPLTVGVLLLVASMAIWAMRFFSKIYLSERHLALNSEERKAFTEAYLALVMDKSVSREQEAIVLATLFRPSQDGVVRDEDSGMDISAAAILAKAIAGPKP